jgi:hypothetical protein
LEAPRMDPQSWPGEPGRKTINKNAQNMRSQE